MKNLNNSLLTSFFDLKTGVFFLFSLLQVGNLYAQFQIRASTIESRCSATGQLSLTVTGGVTPYSFQLLNSTRPVQTSNVFDALPPNTYQIRITDFNGTSMVVNATVAGNYRLPTAQCTTQGSSVTLSSTGGRAPFSYSVAYFLGQNYLPVQLDSVFKCLPFGSHNFRVSDSCGNTHTTTCEVNVRPLSSEQPTCEVVNGKVNIKATASNGELPYSFTCTNNLGEVFQNSTGIFTGLRGCDFKVLIKDRCSVIEKSLSCSSLRGYVKCANFVERTATVWAEGGLPPYRFRSLDRSGFSSDGVFSDLTTNDGAYYFSVTDSCGSVFFFEVLKMQLNLIKGQGCPYNGDLDIQLNQIVSAPNRSCTNCQSFYPYQFDCTNCSPPRRYIDSQVVVGNPLVPVGKFLNMAQGVYNFIVTNGCRDTIHLSIDAKPTPPLMGVTFDCKTNIIKAKIQLPDSLTVGAVYILHDSLRRVLTSNSTGIFQSPYRGMFWIYGVIPQCDTAISHIRTDFKPTYCYKPSSLVNPTTGECEFRWHTESSFSQQTLFTLTGTSDSVNISNTTGRLGLLKPNTVYFLKTDCLIDTFTTPEAYLPNLAVNFVSACGFQSIVRATGRRSLTTNAYGCEQSYIDKYVLLDDQGRVLAVNTSGQFPALKLGKLYEICILTPEGCYIQRKKFTPTAYQRPNLTASYGLICASGQTTGTVRAILLRGGIPPYTFRITSPPNIASPIISRDTSVVFTNLPTGSYVLSVADSCGNTADFATSVGTFNFTPQYSRQCDGRLTLEVPYIDSATYEWSNNAGIVVGNKRILTLNDVSAQTFNIKISTPQPCSFTKSINIPAFTPSNVVANAGVDFISTNATAFLNAQALPQGYSGRWRQIAPSAGTSLFTNPTSPNSLVAVNPFPGEYTFVWEITNTQTGCISADTVFGIFCNDAVFLTTQITTSPTNCKKATGKASVTVTNVSTSLTYLWSNGKTTPSVDSLAAGIYTVTITSPFYCSPPKIDTIIIKEPQPTPPRTIDTALCAGSSLRIGIKTYTQTGIYRDTLTNTTGCDSILITHLTINRLATEKLIPVHNLTAQYCGDSLALNLHGDSSLNYLWSWQNVSCPSCFNPRILPLNTPVYFVTVTDKTTNCSVQDSVNIKIEGSFKERVPNAFSPNGDGINEVFNVIPDPCIKTTTRLQIYNRWGQLIFDKANLSPHKNEGWDAVIKGQYAASDVYVFIMDILFIDGTSKRIVGEINLIH